LPASECLGFTQHGERAVAGTTAAAMVRAARARELVDRKGAFIAENAAPSEQRALFAQILGKFYFVDLSENFRLILFNYGEKRSRFANVAFKAAC
jgi:hypothetical protein